MSSSNIWDHVQAILAIVAGALMIVAPSYVAARSRHAHDQRLADRLARGSDAYFEELRALQAYQPMKGAWAIRLVGAIFAALGLILLYLNEF